MLCEERGEPRARGGHVLGAMQLQHDAGHLVLAAAVDQLLRQREMHGDVVVVELLDALRLGAGDVEADDVGRAAGGRGEQVDLRQVACGRLRAARSAARSLKSSFAGRGTAPGSGATRLAGGGGQSPQLERRAEAEDAREPDADQAARLVVVGKPRIRVVGRLARRIRPRRRMRSRSEGTKSDADEGLGGVVLALKLPAMPTSDCVGVIDADHRLQHGILADQAHHRG